MRYQFICLNCLIDKTRDVVQTPGDVVAAAHFVDGDSARAHRVVQPTHTLVAVIDGADLLDS